MDKGTIKSAMEEVLDARRPVNIETVEKCVNDAVNPVSERLVACETKLDTVIEFHALPTRRSYGSGNDKTLLAMVGSNKLSMLVLLLVICIGVLGFGRNLVALPGAESKPNVHTPSSP